MRGRCSNAPSAISAQNKELSQIPCILISGDWRPFFHQSESCQFVIDSDEKRVPAGFAPIKGKSVISKLSVRPDLDVEKLAEIVGIELKQVRQDRRLFCRGRNHFYLRCRLLW